MKIRIFTKFWVSSVIKAYFDMFLHIAAWKYQFQSKNSEKYLKKAKFYQKLAILVVFGIFRSCPAGVDLQNVFKIVKISLLEVGMVRNFGEMQY